MNEEFLNLKSEISYLDDNNNIVDEEHATHAIVRELDENGNLVRETFLVVNNESDERMAITNEEYENLKSMGLVGDDFDNKFVIK